MKKRFQLNDKFYILGYSFGVNVALELAAMYEKEGNFYVSPCQKCNNCYGFNSYFNLTIIINLQKNLEASRKYKKSRSNHHILTAVIITANYYYQHNNKASLF